MNIFSLPLYYISFKKNKDLEKNCKKHGFKNINHFLAVNGKKLNPKKLLNDKLISIRSYDDLLTGRDSHSGISSLGAIGCTMSHHKLWNLCIREKLPYIIILEEDNYFDKKFTKNNINKINKILSKPKSIFLSPVKKIKYDKNPMFFGTHFYIASNEACKELVKNTFPIDVQTDWYMSKLHNLEKINIEGFKISKQKLHRSSIQDICIKCILPKNLYFYIIVILLFIFLTISVIYLSRCKCINP